MDEHLLKESVFLPWKNLGGVFNAVYFISVTSTAYINHRHIALCLFDMCIVQHVILPQKKRPSLKLVILLMAEILHHLGCMKP